MLGPLNVDLESSGNRQKFRDDENFETALGGWECCPTLYSSLLHICPRSSDTPDGSIYMRIMRTKGVITKSDGMNYLLSTSSKTLFQL